MGGEYDPFLMMRCPGPALSPPVHNTAFRINGRVYLVVGQHKGSHETWSCLEDIETGERKDYSDIRFEGVIKRGDIEPVSDMELIARMSK